MRQKRSIIFLGVIIQTCFVFGQEWTDNKIIYVDNTTMESANPEKVEIEFKWAKCIELNLGKKETIINGKSYYRLKTNISKTDCTISGKLDYADCNGNITTEPFSKNLDDWMKLNIGNSFDGVKLIKVYDIVMSGCKTTPEKEKNISPNPNNGHTIIVNSKQDNTASVNGFYFFGVIKVPTDKGIFDIYTAPLYYEGDSPDDEKLKTDMLLFYDSKLKEAVKAEAEKILQRKLKPQGKKASADEIEKQTEEILNQIKESPEDHIAIWKKTVNINHLAKTESKSKEQMQEVISTMKTTLYGLCGDDTYPNCYRYIILNKEDNNESGNQLSSIKKDDADNKKKDDISEGQTKKIFDLFFGQGSSTDFSVNDEDIKVAKSLLTELINRSCQMAVVEGLQSLDISLISFAESIYTMTSNCNNAKNKGKYYEVIRNAIAVKWKSAFSIRKQTGEW